MKTERIRSTAVFILIMFFFALIYAIIQVVQLIKTDQFTFMAFLQLCFTLIPYLVIYNFADATYEALNSHRLSSDDAEVLKNYSDGPR